MGPNRFFLGQSDNLEGTHATLELQRHDEDPIAVPHTCYSSISLRCPMRRATTQTYKVVVSFPASQKREQLHIRQGYTTRYVK
jgi:hypothetical protein